jgi:hypothetical protein
MRGAGGDVQARVRLARNLPHIIQGSCNGCNVFLTRDEDSIVIPHGYWRDTRFPQCQDSCPRSFWSLDKAVNLLNAHHRKSYSFRAEAVT